ncbi:MAG: transcriptional initiation protein Tat [Proteobacteria bacterium]|nr:transcriptional initiation protein Tat [Pseudomonadota bacterium]
MREDGRQGWSRREMLNVMAWTVFAGISGTDVAGFGQAQSAEPQQSMDSLLPQGSQQLATLMDTLAKAPHRRDFKTVPMMLTDPEMWDAQAIHDVLHYPGNPKMVWHNTELEGPWLNLMRLTLNAQIWSFKHPNFLIVSVTHGSAALALFDEQAWTKYEFPKLTKNKVKRNTFIDIPAAAFANPADFQNPEGAYSAKATSIAVLQRRGVVFMACHDGIWGLAGHLHSKGHNPDRLSQPQLAADLTNHLIPGAILTPDVVAELVALERAGFAYAHS